MNGFLVTAIAMLVALVPCGIVVVKGAAMEAMVAFEGIASVMVMVLMLIPEGFNRTGEFELPLLSAVLMYGSGLVFLRFLERGPVR
ncbi:MAG TPA: hypothetical protein VFQ44_02950 [Streptosporangiaceae bacterium]|nr:hypothetical protein [Streptosporangiaceae bacterium]